MPTMISHCPKSYVLCLCLLTKQKQQQNILCSLFQRTTECRQWLVIAPRANKKKNKNLFFVFAFCCFVLFWQKQQQNILMSLSVNKKKNKNLFFVFAFCCFVLFWQKQQQNILMSLSVILCSKEQRTTECRQWQVIVFICYSYVFVCYLGYVYW